MSTVVDGIAEGVQESPEKVDYSTQIRPEEMPETKRAQMEASRRLISILCEKGDSINVSEYYVSKELSISLPSIYKFENFSIKFLPFWSACFIVLDDRELSVRLPNKGEDFSEYVDKLCLFANEYASLPRTANPRGATPLKKEDGLKSAGKTGNYSPSPQLSKREQLVIRFQNEMKGGANSSVDSQ